jgi:flagellin
MTIRNNLIALNTLNRLNFNTAQVRKSSERLSSGFRINRAGDDAAGLAISMKMHAQIRGLQQSIRNANDGISLVQTAEGALNETHNMLKRVKELTVQASNDTYTNEEREYMQMEIDQILEEVDRISKATDFNGIKLLDGSLGAVSRNIGEYGANFGVRQFSTELGQYINVSASNSGVVLEFAVSSTNEFAVWDSTGKHLTINLAEHKFYSDAQINKLIRNAITAKTNQSTPAQIEFRSDFGVVKAVNFTSAPTVAGVRQKVEMDLLPLMLPGGILGHADKIRFTANQFGSHTNTDGVFSGIRIVTDSMANQEKVTVSGNNVTLHLATGTVYTERDIENLLSKSGFDYSVEMHSTVASDGIRTAYFTSVGEISAFGAPTVIPGNGTATITDAVEAMQLLGWPSPTIGMALNVNFPNQPPSFDNIFRLIFERDSSNNWTVMLEGLVTIPAPLPHSGILHLYLDGTNHVILNSIGGFIANVNSNSNPDVISGRIVFETLPIENLLDANYPLNTMTFRPPTASAVVTTTGGIVIPGNFPDGQGLGRNSSPQFGTGLTLQIGANNAAYNRMTVNINSMDSNALGLSKICVRSIESARNSIDMADSSITLVSRQRSSLGAMQNRLEHTVNSLTNSVENLKAAKSQILDADMAAEIVNYTKYNILQQVAQAMLAQVMQQPQMLLQLFR